MWSFWRLWASWVSMNLQSAVGSVLSTALDARAVSDVTAAAGGTFAVGVHVATVSSADLDEALRFSVRNESRVHQLVLQLAP